MSGYCLDVFVKEIHTFWARFKMRQCGIKGLNLYLDSFTKNSRKNATKQ